MMMQVTDVQNTLCAMSKVCEDGQRIIQDDDGSYIQHKATGSGHPHTNIMVFGFLEIFLVCTTSSPGLSQAGPVLFVPEATPARPNPEMGFMGPQRKNTVKCAGGEWEEMPEGAARCSGTDGMRQENENVEEEETGDVEHDNNVIAIICVEYRIGEEDTHTHTRRVDYFGCWPIWAIPRSKKLRNVRRLTFLAARGVRTVSAIAVEHTGRVDRTSCKLWQILDVCTEGQMVGMPVSQLQETTMVARRECVAERAHC